MESSPFRDRRFAPSDVRRILRRAADLAEADPHTPEAERALTLDEIERLGAELGLPEAAIRTAARDDGETAEEAVDSGSPNKRRVVFEDVIEGELPASRHEDVVDAISTFMGDVGRTQVLGRTLTWTPAAMTGNQQPRALTVTVRSRDGRTRVRVDENLTMQYLGLVLGIGIGVGVGGGVGFGVPLAVAAHAPLVAVLAFLACLAVAVLVPQAIFRALRRSRVASLGQLRARVTKTVREGIAAEGARPRGKKRIAASGDEEAEEEAEAEGEAEVEGARRARG